MQWEDRIGRRLRLRDVHILHAAVQCGSMAKAAERLAISHPVVSKTIADLERALGVRLLERSRQGVEPTLYGKAVLKHGLAAFDELKQCVKEIESLADPAAGEVRIGSIIPLAANFVSAVVDRLSRRYPRIVFHLVTAHVEELRRELGERKVDLLIARRFGFFTDEQCDFETLYDDSYVVVAGLQSPWARRRKIALAELIDQSWVLPPPESAIGAAATEAFRASGLDHPRVTVVTTPYEVRNSLLATGRFLTIFPTSAIGLSLRRSELKVLPVELPLARVPVGIVTLKSRTLSPVAQLVVEHAREVAKPLTKRR